MQKEEKWFDLTELSNRVADTITADEAQAIDTPDFVRVIIERAFQEIAKEVGENQRSVILDDIGTFGIQGRAAREHVNPRTGEKVSKPAYQKLKFKGARALRQIVRENLSGDLSGMEVK
jgi:nucleoid DNA-binding protein